MGGGGGGETIAATVGGRCHGEKTRRGLAMHTFWSPGRTRAKTPHVIAWSMGCSMR